ncbi:MAG: hypothetical protein II075_13150 [Bacteroidales bacterium]|nr:hypothetical protein [Bacteroidales bacterium]
MKVKIEYTKGDVTKEDLLALKEFIERKKIKGVSRVSLATQRPKKGEMGAGLIPALTALIGSLGSLANPFTELAHTLVEMVKLKRSEIRLTGTSGAELCISGKVKEKDLQNAIEKFFEQEKANVKAGSKRATKPTPPPPPPAQNEEKK